MTLSLMLRSAFPLDVLLLVALAFFAGFGWQAGAWLAGRVLR